MYKNFKIFKVEQGTYIVKADSERFGEQAIVFESYSVKECVKWILNNYRNKNGKIITNSRWTDRIYRQAMSTCDIDNNFWYQRTRI